MSTTATAGKGPRAGARGGTPARELQLRVLSGMALGYALDAVLLAGFAADGIISQHIPFAYLAAGLLSCAALYPPIRSMPPNPVREGRHALIQVALSGVVQLAFIALAPQLAFYFLGLLFIAFGFGSLGLSGRQSAIAWTAIAAAASSAHRLPRCRSATPRSRRPTRACVISRTTMR